MRSVGCEFETRASRSPYILTQWSSIERGHISQTSIQTTPILHISFCNFWLSRIFTYIPSVCIRSGVPFTVRRGGWPLPHRGVLWFTLVFLVDWAGRASALCNGRGGWHQKRCLHAGPTSLAPIVVVAPHSVRTCHLFPCRVIFPVHDGAVSSCWVFT